jgi:hypothetical protein
MPRFKVGDYVERVGILVPVCMKVGRVVRVIPNPELPDYLIPLDSPKSYSAEPLVSSSFAGVRGFMASSSIVFWHSGQRPPLICASSSSVRPTLSYRRACKRSFEMCGESTNSRLAP